MTKKQYLYGLNDNDNTYGLVKINALKKEFEKLIEEYIKTDEDEYNVDDFFQFLMNKGYDISVIPSEPEKWFYF